MFTGVHLILLLATLISRADCLGTKEALVQLASENISLIIIVLLLVNLLIATIYEVRNGYRFINFLREKINLLKNRIAEMKKPKGQKNQKVLTE
jgi:hypothetical protein